MRNIIKQHLCFLFVILLLALVACALTPEVIGPTPTMPPAGTVTPLPTEPAPQPQSQTSTPSQITEPKPEGTLMVHFIDVGQGDAILIDLKDIEVLIDGGDRSPGIVRQR
jgi:competence protein ComEC